MTQNGGKRPQKPHHAPLPHTLLPPVYNRWVGHLAEAHARKQQDVNARGEWQASIKTAAAAGNAEFPTSWWSRTSQSSLFISLAQLKLFSQVLLHTFQRKCLQSSQHSFRAPRMCEWQCVWVLYEGVRVCVSVCECVCIFMYVLTAVVALFRAPKWWRKPKGTLSHMSHHPPQSSEPLSSSSCTERNCQL